MSDRYVQRTFIQTYADGTPSAYIYAYLGSPSGTFSDTVQGDQYLFWDQSSANNLAASTETSFHNYVPTFPGSPPGTPPLLPLGPIFKKSMGGSGLSPYLTPGGDNKPPPFIPFNPLPPPGGSTTVPVPNYNNPIVGVSSLWWLPTVQQVLQQQIAASIANNPGNAQSSTPITGRYIGD